MHIDTDLFSSPLSLSLSTSTLTSTFTSTFALIDWFFDWVIWLYIYRRIHISKYNIDNVYIILVFYIYHRLSISIIYTSLSSPLLPPKLRSSGLGDAKAIIVDCGVLNQVVNPVDPNFHQTWGRNWAQWLITFFWGLWRMRLMEVSWDEWLDGKLMESWWIVDG